jgi:Secretion system C-terminal sorting domain
MRKQLLSVIITLVSGLLFSSAYGQTISITASTSDTICSGTSVTFTATATGGTHYRWLKNSIAVGTDATTYATAGLINGDVIQCELLNAPAGIIIALSAPRVMTVQSMPVVAAISGSASVCRFLTTALTDATAGGVWNSTNPFIASVSSSGVVTGINAGVDTISYTVTNTCGTGSATLSFTVNTTPIVPPITGPGTICFPGGATYIDSPAVGTWSVSNPGVASISAGGAVTAAATGIDTVIYSVTNGCGTSVRRRVVAVIVAPVAQPITGSHTVCEGDTIHLHNPLGGGNWHSTNNPVAGIMPGGGGPGGGPTAVIHGNIGGTATIVYVVGNACGVDSSSFTITVYPLPVIYPVTGKDSVCPGDTTTLFEYAAGGTWSAQNGRATVDASGNVIGVTAGIDTIMYSLTNSCGTVTRALEMHVYCPARVAVSIAPVASAISVYPNPAHTLFSIAGINPSKILLVNTLGQTVRNIANTNTVSVTDLPEGMYFLTIFDENGNVASKDRIVKW